MGEAGEHVAQIGLRVEPVELGRLDQRVERRGSLGVDPDHTPSAHRHYAEWSPECFRRWGRGIGPETEGPVIAILHDRPPTSRAGLPHLSGYPAPLPWARPRPGGGFGPGGGARRATYKSIASILVNGLDRAAAPAETVPVMLHPNLRGPRYFH
jgi:hypothetical protein